jgi:preprotein translocase subunit SecY
MFEDFWLKYGETVKKILITMAILVVYRIAMLIVLPGVDLSLLNVDEVNSGFLRTINLFIGGGIERCSVFTVNIMPYISATIITQFLSSKIGFQYFKELKQNRDLGAAKMNEWTQYFTVIIAIIQSIHMCLFIFGINKDGISAVYIGKSMFFIIAIPALVCGSLLTVWMANQISKYGVGQGTSLIIFCNVLLGGSGGISKIVDFYKSGVLTKLHLGFLLIFGSVLFLFVIFVESCKRKITVQYPGIGGKHSIQYLPLKINNAGVIPPVLASSFLYAPQVLSSILKIFFFTESIDKYISYFSHGGMLYYVFSSVLLFVFTISQTDIVFDPEDISKNLQDNGVVVLGVRPGKETSKYLRNIINRLNIIAGIYLIIVCVFSEFICQLFNNSVGVRVLHLGGTSLLILVSVSQLIFKGTIHYNYKILTNSMMRNIKE